MAPRGYAAAYNRVAVRTTQSKEDILVMLYETAVRNVRQARAGIEQKSPKLRGESISKTLAILSELDCALDREAGLEMVDNLASLYRYMMDQLTIANVKDDASALVPVERLLSELKDAFEQAARSIRDEAGARERSTPPVRPVSAEGDAPSQGGFRLAV